MKGVANINTQRCWSARAVMKVQQLLSSAERRHDPQRQRYAAACVDVKGRPPRQPGSRGPVRRPRRARVGRRSAKYARYGSIFHSRRITPERTPRVLAGALRARASFTPRAPARRWCKVAAVFDLHEEAATRPNTRSPTTRQKARFHDRVEWRDGDDSIQILQTNIQMSRGSITRQTSAAYGVGRRF